MHSRFTTPTYYAGYAPRDGLPANPGLQVSLEGGWVPGLGHTGSKLFDISGHGNHSTLVDMVAADAWVVDERGLSLFFDSSGSSDYGTLPGTPSLTRPFTLSAWVYPISVAGFGALLAEDTNNVWAVESSGKVTYYRSGAASATTNLTSNQWSHIAVTHLDNDSVLFYLNGEPDGTGSRTDSSSLDLSFICKTEAGEFFDGRVNHLYPWNRQLSAREIRKLFDDPFAPVRLRSRIISLGSAPAGGGRIMSSLAYEGGLVGCGGLAGSGGGLAG